jgi:hypothetical protein
VRIAWVYGDFSPILYISIKTNGKKLQNKRTTIKAIRYRINQEMKFLYCKKQNLNQQLYHIHLKYIHYCNGMWQHIQNFIDSQVVILWTKLTWNSTKNWTYWQNRYKLHKTLTKHTHRFHPRVINLTNTKFTKEQINTLALGPNYTVEKDPKQYIND